MFCCVALFVVASHRVFFVHRFTGERGRAIEWGEQCSTQTWPSLSLEFPQGQIALAVRRSFSMIAAADLGKVLLDDVSGQTVSRAEIKAAAALNCAAKAFYASIRKPQLCFRPLRGLDGPRPFSLTVHQVMSDATNSSVWKRCKLQSCIIEVGVFFVYSFICH